MIPSPLTSTLTINEESGTLLFSLPVSLLWRRSGIQFRNMSTYLTLAMLRWSVNRRFLMSNLIMGSLHGGVYVD